MLISYSAYPPIRPERPPDNAIFFGDEYLTIPCQYIARLQYHRVSASGIRRQVRPHLHLTAKTVVFPLRKRRDLERPPADPYDDDTALAGP